MRGNCNSGYSTTLGTTRKSKAALATLVFAAAAGLGGHAAYAQNTVFNWTGGGSIGAPSTGVWSTGTNWDTNSAPGSSVTIELNFNGSGSSAYTATDDITGALSLNEILLSSTASVTETLAASAATNTLSFATNTTGPMIVQNGSGAFNISNNLVLAGGFNVSGTGTGAVTLAGNISGGGSFGTTAFSGGTLNLTGTATYTGATLFGSGTTNYIGAASSTGSLAWDVGNTAGQSAVVNINTTGTVADGTGVAASTFTIGDTGASGAVNISAGTVNFNPSAGNYLTVGNGGYGSLVVSGGTLTVGSATNLNPGFRIGGNNAAALGVFMQTGGTVNSARYFAIGNQGVGIATFTGGTTTINPSYRTIVGDSANTTAVFNLGTEAGGTSVYTNGTNTGFVMIGNADTNAGTGATVNLNSGTLIFAGQGILKVSAGTGVVNLNGATLATSVTGFSFINNTPTSVNVFNGGAIFNVSGSAISNTVSANLLATTGNGIYAAGGTIPVSSGGTGYIGAPVVTVTSSDSGTGATAIANVSPAGVITGVTMTSPGQGYTPGATLSFAFAGGGASAAAPTFNYTIAATADPNLAANGTGGVTQTGTGTLILTGANTYTGPTTVSAGTIQVGSGSTVGNLGATSGVSVASGATLAIDLSTAFNLPSPVSGAGGLKQMGSGTTTITGTANYSGPTTITNGILMVTPTAVLGNPTIVASGTGTFAPQAGSGTIAIGTGSASLTLNPGGKFDMTDNAIGITNLVNTAAGTGLAINSTSAAPTTFTFELASSSVDQLMVTGLASMTGSNALINITPLASDSSLVGGNYTLITTSGGLVPADFSLGAQNITIGSTIYHLSLTNSTSTREILSVTDTTSSLAAAYWEGSINNNWATNNSGSTNWRTDANSNIDTGKIPESTTNVYFTTADGGSNLTTTLGGDQSINSLNFDGYASGLVTIGGTNTLTIAAQAINGNTDGNGINLSGGSSAVTISANVDLAGDQTWTNSSSNPLTVSGSISGNRALTFAGGGTLVLSGSNSFSGGFNASAGSVNLNSQTAAGIGTFTVSGNIVLDNTSGAAIVMTANNPQAWNADFTFNGSNDLDMGSGPVTMGASRTVTLNAGNLAVGSVTDGGAGYTLTTVGAGNLAINAGLQAAVGLHLTGTGTVTLAGSSTHTGLTSVSGGTLNITGSATGNGPLDIGNTAGQQGVVNINSAGTVNFSGPLSGAYYVNIGDLAGGTPVAGALNITSGTVNLLDNVSGAYMNVGNGGYGSFTISGGAVTIGGPTLYPTGIRTAAGSSSSVGIMTQTGGSLTLYRYLAEGNAGYAISTFTGGTTTLNGFRTIVGDNVGTVAVMNLGTQAGGTSFYTTGGNGGMLLNNSGSSTATLNLNAGTLNLSQGSIYNGNTTSGTAVVNLNGAVIQAGVTGLVLIDNSPTSVNVYNGGANFNVPSGSTATVSANMLATTGNGIYAGGSTGSFAVPNDGSGGSAYVGSPVALVQGGSGSGAFAVANLTNGVVTSVTMTNPGQGYQAGDNLSFILSDGGINTSASGFNYTLTAADLAANNGALNKTGAGSLTLSGSSTYTGGSNVQGGTLIAAAVHALSTGPAILSDGTTLGLSGLSPFTNLNSNGVYNPVAAGSSVLLTNGGLHEATSAFSTSPITVSDAANFSVSFTYNHNNVNGGDGITFILQSQGANALGGSGGALGYLLGVSPAPDTPGVAITPSVGLDINLYTAQVGFVAGGILGTQTPVGSGDVTFLENDISTNVTLNYTAATQLLTETFSNAAGSYTMSENVDLSQLLGGAAGGSTSAYYGFTGATGGATDSHTVTNFSFSNSTSAGLQIANAVNVVDGASASVLLTASLNGGVGPVGIGNGSTLIIASNVSHGVLATPSVTFTPTVVGGNVFTGKLDVSSNGVDITGGTNSLATVTAWAASGFHNGAWDGPGIDSSAAAADPSHLTAVGVISNTDPNGHQVYGSGTTLGLFQGLNPSPSDILVKYTYYGDANLDGAVDGSDYTLIDNGFTDHLTGWYNGDFNYDGVVDGSDYTLIDNAFNTQGSSLGSNPAGLIAGSASQLAGAASVPEPATLGIVTISALGLLGRRRRRQR